jgi:hypothetical protein
MSDGMTWLVRRFHWRKFPTSAEPRYVRLPGAWTVAEFDDRADAEADRWQREQALRERINPFRCGFDLADCTHLPAYAFKDFLLDDSVRPAKYDSYARINWGKWWDTHSPGWNFDRRGRIWEGLDKVRFFEVVGRKVDRQLFVAVEAVADLEPHPIWGDRMRYGYVDYGTEGGRPVRAFRSRADAEAHLELFAEAADDPTRIQIDTDPFTHPDAHVRLPADRVYDVPLDGELSPFQPMVFVVCRVGFRVQSSRSPSFASWEFDQYLTGEVRWAEYLDFADVSPTRYAVRRPRLVPEAAFTTCEAAEADMPEREHAARRWLNPHLIFDFYRGRGGERAAQSWSANISNAPDAAFDEAWAAFPSHRLFEVSEIAWE